MSKESGLPFVHVDVRLTDNRARARDHFGDRFAFAKAVTPANAARLAAAKVFGGKPSDIVLHCEVRGIQASRRPRLYVACWKGGSK